MRRDALTVLALLVGACTASAAEVPRDKIDAAIHEGLDVIIRCQRENGSFVLGKSSKYASFYSQFPVGQTALALLALEYARPRLSGEPRQRLDEVIRRAVAFVVQTPAEQRTYTAALVISALSMEGSVRYRKIIDFYAAMLAVSQHDKGTASGEWGYKLALPPWLPPSHLAVDTWGDKSNTQFALLGLYMASRAGFQVPKVVWERSAMHYLGVQFQDGGWGYNPLLRPSAYSNMTLAGTISLNLCEEMLSAELHQQCKIPPPVKAVDGGLAWISNRWNRLGLETDTYGLYALERLGILMGRANIGGHDWYSEGANKLVKFPAESMFGTPEVTACFAVIFLARGLEPIVINKLERKGTTDWNNDPYDVKHVVDHLTDHYQMEVQWRIVTLDAPLDLLLRTPILYVSGHLPLNFTPEEKQKLKAYVDGGGTILGQACCSQKPFADSFRALAKELFKGDLLPVPAGHRIFERMKGGADPALKVEYLALDSQQGRPVVIFLPEDYCCRWHVGGTGALPALEVGSSVYYFVTIEGRQMYLRAHPEAEGTLPPPPPVDPLTRPKLEEGPPVEPIVPGPDAGSAPITPQ